MGLADPLAWEACVLHSRVIQSSSVWSGTGTHSGLPVGRVLCSRSNPVDNAGAQRVGSSQYPRVSGAKGYDYIGGQRCLGPPVPSQQEWAIFPPVTPLRPPWISSIPFLCSVAFLLTYTNSGQVVSLVPALWGCLTPGLTRGLPLARRRVSWVASAKLDAFTASFFAIVCNRNKSELEDKLCVMRLSWHMESGFSVPRFLGFGCFQDYLLIFINSFHE